MGGTRACGRRNGTNLAGLSKILGEDNAKRLIVKPGDVLPLQGIRPKHQL